MIEPLRLAFIGNSPPRRCGIATFTSDLQQAVSSLYPRHESCIVAMTDKGEEYDYPAIVRCQIHDDRIDDYVQAAEFLNANKFEIACLQHEFGIFGGREGDYLMALLSRLAMPVVTTLHTVLAEPTPNQRDVLDQVVRLSSKVVVMADKGRELLETVYGVSRRKIEVVPHGVPDSPFAEPDLAKAEFGFSGRPVILTFGLLSPNKGIEIMIDAMPAILARRADAVYVVLGATHPNLIRQHGEAYRESLEARVRHLGIEGHVAFVDRFVDQATLLRYIAMCDVYVTPYLNEAQMTSGSLAYSFGLGKSVVSTPYWHARELLAGGRGVLVPFGDVTATAAAVTDLLTDDARRNAMRERAYAASRSMTWENVAARYAAIFQSALEGRPVAGAISPSPNRGDLPHLRFGHLSSMCDDTGLYQHALYSVPDRAHGYCVDDNARGLLLACILAGSGERSLPEALTSRFAAFIQHAWNPETRRFRNFMSFDRRWLEESGSEDSHGRTMWALGECARSDPSPSRRGWARALFVEALPAVEHFSSPRAWAFALLGLDGYCTSGADRPSASAIRRRLADGLMDLQAKVRTEDWIWYEAGLAYDNARLSQALIVTGVATGIGAYVKAGLDSLRWLIGLQTTAAGIFRPVGSDSFHNGMAPPEPFDQQPLEAAAAVSACLAAWGADGDPEWLADAGRAFAWFLGRNDLMVPLVDPETGSCRDGLHPTRVNENRGGESAVSYLLALSEMREAAVLDEQPDAASLLVQARRNRDFTSISRGPIVTSTVPEPAGLVSAARSGAGRR